MKPSRFLPPSSPHIARSIDRIAVLLLSSFLPRRRRSSRSLFRSSTTSSLPPSLSMQNVKSSSGVLIPSSSSSSSAVMAQAGPPPPPDAVGALNLRSAIGFYIERMLNSVSGMKTLLLDDETKTVVSLVFTQSQILEKGVFLTSPLVPPAEVPGQKMTQQRTEKMTHLNCIIMCRPTRTNVQEIIKAINNPLYGEYHLFFTNTVTQEMLRDLAENDVNSLVKNVHEFYADFLAINDDLFEFGLEGYLKLSRPRSHWTAGEDSHLFKRSVKGLLAVLLSLKLRPANVRYQNNSEIAQHVAREIKNEMEKERGTFESFPQYSTSDPVLLILDRREDAVTPLLTQWTYQAMVHELLGMKNNIVSLESAPNVDPDFRQVVLSQGSDDFFAANMYRDYGALAENARRILDTYRAKFDTGKQLKTVEDMQKFVEEFPDFRKLATNATKHVTVVGELARLIERYHLLDLSALEQDLATTSDHTSHLERVRSKLVDPEVAPTDKLRLVLLYALRYETHGGNRIAELKNTLRSQQVIGADVQLVDEIMTYGGAARRSTSDLFGSSSQSSTAEFLSKTISQGLSQVRGGGSIVENVFTQHKPLLHKIIGDLRSGRTLESKFPSVFGPSSTSQTAMGPDRTIPPPYRLVVFICGGATFEEAACVAEINAKANNQFRVVLGGSNVQNSKSFLKELSALGLSG